MNKSQFTEEQLMQLSMNRTPRGYVWHHGVVPGKIHLVKSHTHRQTGHSVGYCNWPKKENPEELAAERRKAASKEKPQFLWGFNEPLDDEMLISQFAKQEKIKFPDYYLECVLEWNGAYPKLENFITEEGTLANMKCLLSFNKDSEDSIWVFPDYRNRKLRKKYVCFAEDSFGNYICFQKADMSIVLINHETEKIERIAPDFRRFIEGLYGDAEEEE